MAKEIILVIGALLSMYFIFASITRINNYDSKNKMEKSTKMALIYLSIVIPILGYLLTRRLKLNK